MAEAAARLIKLRARQTGQPDTRELRFAESFQKLIEMMKDSATWREKRINCDINSLRAADHEGLYSHPLYGKFIAFTLRWFSRIRACSLQCPQSSELKLGDFRV